MQVTFFDIHAISQRDVLIIRKFIFIFLYIEVIKVLKTTIVITNNKMKKHSVLYLFL